MDKMCIDNFLEKSNPRHVEGHSDSSDFETPDNIPVKKNTVTRGGDEQNNNNNSEIHNDMISRRMCDGFRLYNVNTQYDRDIPEKCVNTYPIKQFMYNYADCPSKSKEKQYIKVNSCLKKREHTISRSPVTRPSKIRPRLSNILGCSEKIIKANNKHCESCLYCEHKQKKKYSKSHRKYSVQPVYALEREVKESPYQKYNEISQIDAIEKQSSDYINDYILSSGSEQEDFKTYKHKKMMKYIIRKIEKHIGKQYANVEMLNHQKQQYPSKSKINLPCQVFATSSCQTKKCCTDSEEIYMSSKSSEFWDLLVQKIKNQMIKADETKYTMTCKNDNCQFSKTSSNNLKKSSSTETAKILCKCLQPNKTHSPNEINLKDHVKPCQDDHDTLKKSLAEKYNREVLCIHNTPCILINGCLNLPQPKSANAQTKFYPQSKRSSFVQMCRKIKRSKQRCLDQATQYLPSAVDLEEYLPEFRTEKIVQSICHHNPPCEVVHGCHKPPYNPTLQTSCVHVPMCPNFPECCLEEKSNKEEYTCNHTPKCAELPLCSRKYISLTAKENATTQVKPKAKIGCRHQPPCIMLPKCLAQALCGDWYPGNTIPGCVHQPSCDMIPACCRTQAKSSVSAQCQYPSAPCPIV